MNNANLGVGGYPLSTNGNVAQTRSNMYNRDPRAKLLPVDFDEFSVISVGRGSYARRKCTAVTIGRLPVRQPILAISVLGSHGCPVAF